MKINNKIRSQTLFTTPIEKLWRGFRKLKAILRMKRAISQKKQTVANNPMFHKFIFLAVFWVLIHLFVYFYLIYHSNEQSNMNVYDSLVCFFKDGDRCQNPQEWFLIKVFYTICVLYVFVGIKQIHKGCRIFKSRVTNFTVLENVGHASFSAVPFLREINIFIDMLANKTALQFRHKLLYHDIKYILRSAKFSEISRHKTTFKIGNRFVQIMIGLGILIIGFIILFGPMFLFLDQFMNNEPMPIKHAELKINILDKQGIDLGNLFQTNLHSRAESNIFREIKQKVTKKSIENHQIINPKLMRSLSISKHSLTRQNIQDRFFKFRYHNDLNGIKNEISNGSVQLILTLRVYYFFYFFR